jgi:hypothetical protein
MARAIEGLEATAGTPGRSTAADAPLTSVRQQSSGFRLLRRLRGERKAMVGLVIIALLALIAVFGPMLAPYHPDNDDFELLQPPSLQHPMGTDSFGRDLFSRLIIGTRVSFSVGFLAAAIAGVVGGLLGITAGYYGGWVDSLISRAVDLLWAFPVIILAVALVAMFGAGFHNVVIAIALAYVDDFARIVRGETLSLRDEPRGPIDRATLLRRRSRHSRGIDADLSRVGRQPNDPNLGSGAQRGPRFYSSGVVDQRLPGAGHRHDRHGAQSARGRPARCPRRAGRE